RRPNAQDDRQEKRDSTAAQMLLSFNGSRRERLRRNLPTLLTSLPPPFCQPCAHHRGIGVFDGLENLQRRLGTRDGLRPLTELVQREGGVEQSAALPPSIADLAGDLQVLLVELDGLAGVAQNVVGAGEIAEGVAFPASVAGLVS